MIALLVFFLLAICILPVGLVFFAILLRPSQLGEKKEGKIYTYVRKRYFLTSRESECYKHLVELAGAEYFIFAQVSLGSLLDERKPGQSWVGARAHINRKSVDFLLCDKQYISPILAIELDDWTHNRPNRIERDREVERIFQEANMPLLRIRNSDELEQRLPAALVSKQV